MKQDFKEHLARLNLAQNTITAYLHAVDLFEKKYGEVNKKNLLSFKGYLVENFKPKTANLRIQAINNYLRFLGKEKLCLKAIKIQQKPFLENVISDPDYRFFKASLKKDNQMNWYFVVRFLAATGARVSELVQIKVEHVVAGYIDLYSKGGKIRRIYIPSTLQKECLQWLETLGRSTGYLFINKSGRKVSTRGLAGQLKKLGVKYGLEPSVIYPHSFRHRFAKNFLEKYNDSALLADLMGHDSIETTRIYLRRTAQEQRAIVDKIVIW